MIYVLGAQDPEMSAIEDMLVEQNMKYAYASVGKKRVSSGQAYDAEDTLPPLPANEPVCFIECSIKGIQPAAVIDHHNPGDPGYDKPPAQYWDGSSIGQYCTMNGIPPTPELRLIAAADHCLTAAYRGLCPGVDPEDLAFFRLTSRAQSQGRKLSDVMNNIRKAELLLELAPKEKLFDEEVFDIGNCEELEIAEAAARSGLAYIYESRDREGNLKRGIKGASEPTVRSWMEQMAQQRLKVYGCPARGYAGAYLE